MELERQRLIELGVEVSVPFDNREEGYREIRLHDPDGNSLTLFAWIDPTGARQLSGVVDESEEAILAGHRDRRQHRRKLGGCLIGLGSRARTPEVTSLNPNAAINERFSGSF